MTDNQRSSRLPQRLGELPQRACILQVMPQLLSSLGIDDEQDNALDWGTLAVYSCAASCDAKQAYAEEFVWVQP